MTGRSVPEWVGDSPDSKIPDHVKLRIWHREKGHCHISGRKILTGEPYDYEHKIALCNWVATPEKPHGNRESNIFPALRDKHKEKTKKDRAEKAEFDKKQMKHFGIKKKSGFRKPPPGYNSWTRRIET